MAKGKKSEQSGSPRRKKSAAPLQPAKQPESSPSQPPAKAVAGRGRRHKLEQSAPLPLCPDCAEPLTEPKGPRLWVRIDEELYDSGFSDQPFKRDNEISARDLCVYTEYSRLLRCLKCHDEFAADEPLARIVPLEVSVEQVKSGLTEAYGMIEASFASFISDMRYDASSEELEVNFASGHSYTYSGVPYEVAKEFATSSSPGSYFNSSIRGVYD